MGKTRKDRGNYDQIPSKFKKKRKRIRRAKSKQLLRENKDIPKEKKNDKWEWW